MRSHRLVLLGVVVAIMLNIDIMNTKNTRPLMMAVDAAKTKTSSYNNKNSGKRQTTTITRVLKGTKKESSSVSSTFESKAESNPQPPDAVAPGGDEDLSEPDDWTINHPIEDEDEEESLEGRLETPSPSELVVSLDEEGGSPSSSPWPTLPPAEKDDGIDPLDGTDDSAPVTTTTTTAAPSYSPSPWPTELLSAAANDEADDDTDNDPSDGTDTGTATNTDSSNNIVSVIPSDPPSLIPSDSPSLAPSALPSSADSTITSTSTSVPTPSPSLDLDLKNNSPFTSSYVRDPNDSTSFVCSSAAADGETTTALDDNDDTRALPVTFVYELRLDEDSLVDLTAVLFQVESAMAKAVADALLTCEDDNNNNNDSVRRVRRLAQGVWSVSSSPQDTEKAACAIEGCHLVNGALTLHTIVGTTTGTEDMAIVCDALEIVQDPATMTRIATSIEGVGAIRYEESNIECVGGVTEETVGDSIVEEESDGLDSNDSSLGGAATFGIALGAVVVVLAFLVVASRRRRWQGEDLTDAGSNNNNSKDMLSLQPSNTMSSIGGGGYTILADTNSLRDPEEEQEEPDFPILSKGDADEQSWKNNKEPTKGGFGSNNFRPFIDQTDLPDRLSLQSSEGGSVDDDDNGNTDTDDNSDTLAHYATPFQLSSERKRSPSKKGSSPQGKSLQVGTTNSKSPPPTEGAATTGEPREDNDNNSPRSPSGGDAYPGLSSLLGRASDSDGSTTDEDRSIAQLVYGGARLLKLSDLEANHKFDDHSTSSQDDDDDTNYGTDSI